MRGNVKDIATYIKMFVDDSITELNPYLLQGKLNNEYISGNQNKKINIRHLKIEEKKLDPQVYTEKKIFNRILPIYLTRYGILTQNMPIPGIIPTGYSSKEISDCNNCNIFIPKYMNDVGYRNIYKKIIKWTDIYGISWIKTGIDWSQGDVICEIPNTKIGDMTGTLIVKEGKTFTAFCPIHEVFVDSYYVETMDDVNELVHRRVFPVEYIRKRWGFAAEKESINEAKLSTYPRYTNFGMAQAGSIEYAYVYEYYKKPDAMYPKGRYVISCNNKILYDDILPYENGEGGKRMIPFDFVTMQSIPNKLIGVTVYSQIIPIQDTYNSIKNRYLEYVNHIAIGQLYYWEGSLINKNNFTNKPGKLIGLKRNAKAPQPVQKDKLADEYTSYLKTLEDDMLITAGLSQITAFGSSKSNVRTDGVVDKMSESDDNKLVNAIDNISEFEISIFKKVLYLEKQRHDVLYKQLELAKKDTSILQYNLQGVDPEQLSIINREFLMTNDQVFDKKLQQAGNFGLYNPNSGLSYRAKKQVLDSMKASYLIDTLDPQERATYDLCMDEQRQFMDNKIPEVFPYHEHAQHIAEHNIFRISPEVRCLREKDEKKYNLLQEALEKHIGEHQKYLEQNQQSNVIADAKEALKGTTRRSQG